MTTFDPDTQRSLYEKFAVRRVDPEAQERHPHCAYFVLDLTHDQHAPAALSAYATSCQRDYPSLSADLMKLLNGQPIARDARPGHLNWLAQRIHDNAAAHGFWDGDRNFGEMIALAHSELSEALEEHRSGNPAMYVPEHAHAAGWDCDAHCKPEGTAVELADCIIRCLDTLHSLGVDIDAVVARKMEYNASRPHKHGRAY